MANKVVVVRQRDSKDCGACCLQSLIRYYDGYVSLEKIREDTFTNNNGTSVYHIVKAAKKYGFDAIAKKSLDNDLSNISFPAIIHVKYSNGLLHFLVIYERKKDDFVVMDPAKGIKKMPVLEIKKIFTGVFIELYPSVPIVLQNKEKSIYSLFVNIVKSNRKLCRNIIIVSIICPIITIIASCYFKIGYQLIEKNTYNNTLIYVVYIFLIIGTFKLLFELFKEKLKNQINKNVDATIFKNFISHIFNLPLKVISSHDTGEIISRINELNEIKNLFSEIFINNIFNLFLAIGTLVFLFIINSRITLILCLTAIIYILVSIIINPYIHKRLSDNIDYQTDFNSTLIENIQMINSIKNNHKEQYALVKIEDKICALLKDNYYFSNDYIAICNLQNTILDIGLFIVNTICLYLYNINSLNLVDILLYNSLIIYFLDPIKSIISILPRYNFLRASFNKICDFIDIEEEKYGNNNEFINGDITFNNVEYSYNDYLKIINNFNLTIKQGEKIMIKGKSGSGKSTLCQLLIRNFIPSSGTILINEKNILDYSLTTVRKNIVYVGQKEFLLTDTIKNNILYFNNSNNSFDKVCRICCVDKIVENKKFRYDSLVNNNANNLSGGEKQRIVLARALMQDFNILILDEALSETDYTLERNIITNLIKEYPNKTIIYITHKKQDSLFNKVIDMQGNYE